MEETKEEIQNQEAQHNNIFDFSITNWPKELQKLSLKYKAIKINKSFFDYILEDGVFIHQDYCRDKEAFKNLDKEDLENFHKFDPEIEKQINEVISDYKEVVPKLNWKSPQDCKHWLLDLKVDHIEDLLLTFKDSGLLGDLLKDYEDQFDFSGEKKDNNNNDSDKSLYLILKKFYKLNYKNEFRCFVYNNELRAICQKNTGDFYKDMKETNEIFKEKIVHFFKSKMQNVFKAENNNYCFDIYVEQKQNSDENDKIKHKIYILDIEPWQEFTNPLLYTFEEIQEFSEENKDDSEQILFKYIEDANSTVIRDYSCYRIPEELAEDPSMDNIANLMEMMKSQNPDLYQ